MCTIVTHGEDYFNINTQNSITFRAWVYGGATESQNRYLQEGLFCIWGIWDEGNDVLHCSLNQSSQAFPGECIHSPSHKDSLFIGVV